MKESPLAQTCEQVVIRCVDSDRLLARADEYGVYFFCRQHNKQHMMSWSALQKLHEDILRGEAQQKQVI